MEIVGQSYEFLNRAIRIAYMRGYQVGRRFEKRQVKKIAKRLGKISKEEFQKIIDEAK